MKKTVFAWAVLGAAAAFAEPAVDRVLVRQMWPWDRTVKVEYELSGTTAMHDMTVTVTAGETTYGTAQVLAAKTEGDLYGITAGINGFSFDPQLLFGSDEAKVTFTVRVEPGAASEPNINRIEYRVFDLENGTFADLRRRDFYNDPAKYGAFTTNYSTIGPGFQSFLDPSETFVWTGVNQIEYKTTKLAMKRIYAAGKTFHMGPHPADTNAVRSGTYLETRFQATFTKDFYLGVFELTKGQQELVTGYDPGFFTNANQHAERAFETGFDGTMAKTMYGEGGFCTMASALFGKTIRFPYEAEWEFAAKAGYDGPNFPNGKEVTIGSFNELEGYSAGSGSTDRNSPHFPFVAGRGRPNPNGLYNLFGNVREFMRDQVQTDLLAYYTNRGETEPFVDPRTDGNNVGSEAYPVKGCEFNLLSLKHARPSARFGVVPTQTINQAGCPGVFGCRVMCEAD
ncbi:MAG: formylglycine-generating enzyme family protein [Kiritimatiellia bacterium]